jgi:hypothetical protein
VLCACSPIREPDLADCTVTTTTDFEADGDPDVRRVETYDRRARLLESRFESLGEVWYGDTTTTLVWDGDCAVSETIDEGGPEPQAAGRGFTIDRACDRYGDPIDQNTLIVDDIQPDEPFFNEVLAYTVDYPDGRERKGPRIGEERRIWDELNGLADTTQEPDSIVETAWTRDSRDRILTETRSTVGSDARVETEQSWWENSGFLLSQTVTAYGADGEVDRVDEQVWTRDRYGRPELLETFVDGESFSRETWTWEDDRWAIAERRILENGILVLVATTDCDDAKPPNCVESLDFGSGNDPPNGQPDEIVETAITCR